jgi:hypothetical protein
VLAPTTLPFDEEPLIGSPAIHRQLVRWADALGVGPESGAAASAAVETALPRPRGIGAVAAMIALGAIVELVLGVALLGVSVIAALEGVLPQLASGLVIGVVLTALGIAGLAVALGLWRRRRWAWMAALVVEGLSVIQVLLVVAGSGLQGIVGLGVLQVVIAPVVFFYLTRPHVAAAFGHRSRPGQTPGSEVAG